MIKNILFIFFVSCSFSLQAQKISPNFFSINSWMPDTIGNAIDCPGKKKGIPCHLYGKLYSGKAWDVTAQSGARLIRFGGEVVDENRPTNYQYLKMVDSIRAYGMEPILQIPYNNNYYTADTAAAIVKYINGTMNRNVKYWSIGNEPDLDAPLGYGYISASPIADYIKLFAARMKSVDSTIITLGPELKYYHRANDLVTDLTDPNGYFDITGKVPGHNYYYIDIFTFHYYPFHGNQTREKIINNMTGKYQFEHVIDLLSDRLEACNKAHKRFNQPIKIAITEANINYKNPDNFLNGLGANSFIGGQFWAEMMGIGMKKGIEFISFWSIIEHSLGFIDDRSFTKRPTYHHFKMMAENFKGYFCNSMVNEVGSQLKVIACESEDQIVVMLLNQQNKKSVLNFSLLIGNGISTHESRVLINVKTRLNTKDILFNGSIDDESTSVFVFNTEGRLIKKTEYKMSEGPFAEPKTTESSVTPLIVNTGYNKKKPTEPFIITAGPYNRAASYYWYEGNSAEPLNKRSSHILKVKPLNNTTYKLIAKYEGCIYENCIDVYVNDPVLNLEPVD